MKIVILGAQGQLGRALCADWIRLSRADADLTRPLELRHTLTQLRPSVVVNAAAFTQVERAEAEAAAAFAVNALGVRDLAAICRDLDCTLLHFSTDYVFGLDVKHDAAYDEMDRPGPINVYGASKLAGEQFVQAICPKHFILRTCGLYGHGGSNFVEALLSQAKHGGVLRVVDDQVCTPTSVTDLAAATQEVLASQAYGLYHVTNSGACTWHEFAQAIFAITKQEVSLTPISSEEYGGAARRPRFSVLSNSRWLDRGFTRLRPWHEALADYLHQRGK